MLPVPLEFSVTPTNYEYYGWLLGFGLWIVVMLFIAGIYFYLKDRHLDDEQLRQLNALRPQLADGGWQSLVIREDDDLASYSDDVRAVLEGGDTSQTTLPELVADIRQQWQHRTADTPSLALRLIYGGVLLAILGAVATLTTIEVTGLGGSHVTTGDILHLAGWLLSLFPFSAELTHLVVGGGLLTAQLAVSLWWLFAGVLISGGALLLWLDKATVEDLDVRLYDRKQPLVVWPVAVLASVWAVGAAIHVVGGFIVTGLGLEATIPLRYVDYAGFAVAIIGLGLAMAYAAYDLRRRLVARQNQPENATGPVAAYILVRKVWGVLGALALPVIAGYAVYSVVGGGLAALIHIVVAAPPQTQFLVAAAAGSVLLALGYLYEDRAWDWLRALERAASSRAVRSRAFIQLVLARAATLFTFLGVLFGSMPFLGGFIPGLIAALAAAAVVRLALIAWVRVKYRVKDRVDLRGRGVRDVLIEGRTITDADGDDIYVTRVDGTPHAHRDPETLVERTLHAAASRLDDGSIAESFERYYYEAATDRGTAGISMVADEFRGDIKSRIEGSFADNDGEIGVQSLDDEMTEKYPEPAYRSTITHLRKMGKIDVRNGYYRWHE